MEANRDVSEKHSTCVFPPNTFVNSNTGLLGLVRGSTKFKEPAVPSVTILRKDDVKRFLVSQNAVSAQGYSAHWQGSRREGEVPFSGHTPIFLKATLSLWIHPYPLWNYKMGWPRMGSELDITGGMNQLWKTTSPRPVPAGPARGVANTCRESQHTQNSSKKADVPLQDYGSVRQSPKNETWRCEQD